ncbi:hypothetical protein [Psychrobacter lutiphocae]|uniref:hypothetical protein n=1 Tax=Psychrobacter lutiphocae TaxID=540500 RepID=UPI000369748C|nr:hypothetical protein [Psychrobacter lutiphocae]
MSNSNTAWLCQYSVTSLFNIYGLQADIPEYVDAVSFYENNQKMTHHQLSDIEEKRFKEELNRNISFINKWFASEYIADKNMPTRVYREPNEVLPKPDEVAFKIINGYLVVNQQCYEVMSQFRLGDTHFSEIEIIDMQTNKTATNTPYYFINIAETRTFLDIEKSDGLDGNPYAPNDKRRYIDDPKDNDIKLECTAKDCDVDIWHDPILVRSLFLSDALVQALFDAGITSEDLALVRCTIQS